MSLIFWDTNLFIYLVEEHPHFGPEVTAIRARVLERRDELCTSALTLGEVLVAPIVSEDRKLARDYRALLRPPLVQILPFNEHCSEIYAQIRADRSISRSDALQLACAAQANVDLFITNDRRLSGKYVSGVQFISGIDNCPL